MRLDFNLILRYAAGALLLPAVLSVFTACKGRTADNVVPNGETVSVDIPLADQPQVIPSDSIQAPSPESATNL
ncbi:MAG: hypothetical protein NC328_07685 [Muribaculum sp.]|nr:hypothetical protein [Muribaculum sp.]